MDFSTFKKAFSSLSEIPSVTGSAGYQSIRVGGNSLFFTRTNTGSEETISLSELYHIYQNLKFINTTILRDYISGRAYSPSLAVMIAAGFYDSKGYRIDEPVIKADDAPVPAITKPEAEPTILKSKPGKKEDDETRFFRIMGDVIGIDYLQSKSSDNPVDTDLIDLPCDYRKLSFEPKIQLMLRQIIEALDGDFEFGNIGLANKIDGLIIDHPAAGIRIVEFDEEQHFTPSRKFSLDILSENLESLYFSEYQKICNDTAYLNKEVFPKHRISSGMRALPANINEFREWLDQESKSSGFINPTNGFPYHGGRISQRAYYDTLRDVAHLAKENDHLNPPIRIAKKTLENAYFKSFRNISDEELAEGIKKLLWTFFDIRV